MSTSGGDSCTVCFKFLYRPEYLKVGLRVVFREANGKGIGIITAVCYFYNCLLSFMGSPYYRFISQFFLNELIEGIKRYNNINQNSHITI
jgi:hypothetical protein